MDIIKGSNQLHQIRNTFDFFPLPVADQESWKSEIGKFENGCRTGWGSSEFHCFSIQSLPENNCSFPDSAKEFRTGTIKVCGAGGWETYLFLSTLIASMASAADPSPSPSPIAQVRRWARGCQSSHVQSPSIRILPPVWEVIHRRAKHRGIVLRTMVYKTLPWELQPLRRHTSSQRITSQN